MNIYLLIRMSLKELRGMKTKEKFGPQILLAEHLRFMTKISYDLEWRNESKQYENKRKKSRQWLCSLVVTRNFLVFSFLMLWLCVNVLYATYNQYNTTKLIWIWILRTRLLLIKQSQPKRLNINYKIKKE